MPEIAAPTLDHLRVFLAVVEQGSFNRAARRLGRAISVVSYAISTIESQLGVRLFDREGSRRPLLTPAGEALVADARRVTDDVDALLARMRAMQQGLEAELAIAVDVMVPGHTLALLLRDFQRTHPTVTLRLHVEALGAVAALVLDGRATLGIAGPDIIGHAELESTEVGAVDLVPVAAPGHPLAKMPEIALGEASKHLQLVLTDRSSLTEGKDFSVLSSQTWRLADLGAKHALLKEGIGWGNMPRHAIATDLAAGILRELALPERSSINYRLIALCRKDTPPGPAATWIREEFRRCLA
jgi:DNA-binding transcriptional LysR family regulator